MCNLSADNMKENGPRVRAYLKPILVNIFLKMSFQMETESKLIFNILKGNTKGRKVLFHLGIGVPFDLLCTAVSFRLFILFIMIYNYFPLIFHISFIYLFCKITYLHK